MDGSSHSQVSEMALGFLYDKGGAREVGLPCTYTYDGRGDVLGWLLPGLLRSHVLPSDAADIERLRYGRAAT